VALGQDVAPAKAPLQPIEVDEGFLQQAGVKMAFDSSDETTSAAQQAWKQGRLFSVPTFTTSFTHKGQTYPVTTVGHAPQKGDTTTIATQAIPLSLFFDGFVDANGKNIVLDVTPLLPAILKSPNFANAGYRTGYTQFADAVQRAQFSSVMKEDWHTVLGKPEQLKAVTIEVPANSQIGQIFKLRSTGALFAVVDTSFFVSQLNTIIQLQKLDVQGLPIALTNNVFLAPNASLNQCCVLGFHTAFDAGVREGKQAVQTFAWASYVTPGIFGGTVEDIIALSHEISEWMNDPFVTNATPRWVIPGSSPRCEGNLETGDALQGIPHAGVPITIDGTTYHPQTEALIQWFARKSPSDAIDGAYSFPDETLLTGPSVACAGK
jgi:hypothetical protein